jgi:mRNA interferase MazF
MRAKVVLVHFPFTDLSGTKLRPAIVIHESEQDVIVAFVSSRIPASLHESDLLITTDHQSIPVNGAEDTLSNKIRQNSHTLKDTARR